MDEKSLKCRFMISIPYYGRQDMALALYAEGDVAEELLNETSCLDDYPFDDENDPIVSNQMVEAGLYIWEGLSKDVYDHNVEIAVELIETENLLHSGEYKYLGSFEDIEDAIL